MSHKIVDLKNVPVEQWLRAALDEHPYRPLWWIPGISTVSQQMLFDRALEHALSDDSRSLLGLLDHGRLLGLAELRYMTWDSTHFGFPVYRLDHFAVWGDPQEVSAGNATLASAVVDRARALGAYTVHTGLPMEAIHSIQALEDAGFRTMDILVTWIFEHMKQRISDYPDKCVIRGYLAGDEQEFIPLARNAFAGTPDRFHADPHLSLERCNELYAEWTRNSCSGQAADYIVVAELDGKPAGYTTLKLDEAYQWASNVRTGGLILGAVAPWAEGKGLYTSMINGGLKWLAAQGVEVSHLGTQVNNFPVQRAWSRLGFRLAKAGPSLHLWLGGS